MGVNIYLLEKRRISLLIGGMSQDIGSLRRFWKITELTDESTRELDQAAITASALPSPVAAMLTDVCDMKLASSDVSVKAHLVLGWDEGRTRVTDFGWDYLPLLGYAIRNAVDDSFILQECRADRLFSLDESRARGLGLIGPDGLLLRHGQPLINQCLSVRKYREGFVQAQCILNDGRTETFVVAIVGDALPDPSWFLGKRPYQIEQYASSDCPRSGPVTPFDMT